MNNIKKWEDALETTKFTNTAGWDVEVENKAYDAYLGLKEDLEKDGIYVDLDSAYQRLLSPFFPFSSVIILALGGSYSCVAAYR